MSLFFRKFAQELKKYFKNFHGNIIENVGKFGIISKINININKVLFCHHKQTCLETNEYEF